MKTKQNKTIKILLAVALMFTAFLIFGNTVHAKTKRSTYRTINGIYNSDGTIDTADGYCWKVRKESYAYPGTTVVTVKLTDRMIRERATRHTIYVEIIKSVSAGGRHGTYGKNYYIAYNKRVRKGKHVTSYCVWNPCNAYCDDVEAVADNGKIR